MYNTIIIGSGISGIFTLKHLIDEGETNVLILDKNPEPFGLWNIINKPSVFENTYTVSSKLYMTISDFPLPEDMPEFPHHSLILNYYKDYAKHFNLYQYIKQNCKVENIVKKNNTWVINTNDEIYYSKNIVIATGTVNDCPNIPDDEMYNNFTGEKYHSNSFDKIKDVKDKRILIVGGSDTAVDCAMELKNNNDVTISIKNGVWFQNRNLGAYEPADMLYSRGIDFLFKQIVTKKYIMNKLNPNEITNVQFFWGLGGTGIDIWRPKCDYLNSYYVKSRDVIDQITKGVIIPENGIVKINQKNVTFETNDTYEYDIILFCTGYKPLQCMKFLNEKIVSSQKYKHIFYPNDPSIMFVGFIRPYLTSIPMLSELQSRWVAKVITGKVSLPSTQYMNYENVKDDAAQQDEFPCAYDRLKTIVDPYDYCNMVADNIGAQVNKTQILLENPHLLYIILFGSWNHHVYRLNDPDEEKRKIAIKNIKDVYNEKISVKVEHLLFDSIYYILFNIILTLIVSYLIFYFYQKSITKYFNIFHKKIKSTFTMI
jgi:dimethylaniline monooxygenase (N-oxide forming)